MFYLPGKKRRPIISLTPLIDVVFILLVFFMLASSFLDWRSIPMEASLPPTDHPKPSDDQPLLVGVGETGTHFNGRMMAVDALARPRLRLLMHDPALVKHP